mmetsp:Transcript_16729/g.25448  ORF Transcript_16729/g.25448 Transcript_16729/m.25448 type:complete len:208 (-) Transcript_16729:234-857(-)|eukprot:CAMPEP_0196143134 /NCGR_PEP_ID=MMETSP0910-20130528/12685_1 /TAXON_ID=49265 /ORGANISM="Thalassiosira rotula, Strain GSO102" /LENGTH=207 /DNA_ID=CAMNT_0041404533 /DNA_START=112 /DNA_END=735 /DNA_ORIENTATION=-
MSATSVSRSTHNNTNQAQPFPSMSRTSSLLMLLACCSYLSSPSTTADAFTAPTTKPMHTSLSPTSATTKVTTTRHYSTPTNHSPLEDEPWQADDSYWDELQVASKDPVAFEKFIEKSMERKKQGKTTAAATTMSSSSTSNGRNGKAASAVSDDDAAPKKKSKYVPIEEWDAQNKENMSKEERLQWECQRGGNQFRQNEILMHNLKGF